MDLWFYFLLHNKSSELEALKELSSCNLQYASFAEDLETGDRTLCAIANPSLFPVKWNHILSYKKIENTEINWALEWDSFSPYFQNGLAKIPLSDFLLGSQEELSLLPGPGFGDLSHPTTILSLELLAKYAPNQIIIDLGCGSGILGLSALKWGALFVYGLDIDPAALKHSQENALLNHLENQILLSSTLPFPLTHKPALLVMNMTFEDQKQALNSLSFYPDLWITSGILEIQKKPYLLWAKEQGLQLQNCCTKNGWIACIFKKINSSIKINDINNCFYNDSENYFDKIPFDPILTNLLLKYAIGNEVLDIGSGPGALSAWLRDQGCQVTCIEPSQKLSAQAASKGLKVHSTMIQDFQTDHTYDSITAISSLIHVPKAHLLAQIQKIAKLLNPNGLLFISLIEGSGEDFEDPTNLGKLRYFAKWSELEIDNLLSPSFTLLESHKILNKKMDRTFLLGVYILKS